MERPHVYFDLSGRLTHLGAAAPLNIGDAGCKKTQIASQAGSKATAHASTADTSATLGRFSWSSNNVALTARRSRCGDAVLYFQHRRIRHI